MKSIVKWAVDNVPGMNALMIAVLLIGGMSLAGMRRETFPQFELEIILVSVPYPGASPEDVEEGICLNIEEKVRGIDGIKKLTSVASEGVAQIVLELHSDVKDVQKVLNEVRSNVDRITNFPEEAEDPEIQQITLRYPVIKVAVLGPDKTGKAAERELRDITEKVRDTLLRNSTISDARIIGAKAYQIDVEISEETLQKYGLTLRQVADKLRRENIDLPAGRLRSGSREMLLRGKNKSNQGKDIRKIPLVTLEEGVVKTVGDLANVSDAFEDTSAISRVNGKPGMVIQVERASKEDLLKMAEDVRQLVATRPMPEGYSLLHFGDISIDVEDRMNLLTKNGLQGLLLVFLVLAIFLEFRLAFWVALGIPIAIFGAGAVLMGTGQTLNMLSMFAFLMALGIVVDDAIVIGENIYSHRQLGKSYYRAAIDGTIEVFPSVAASVMTTVIAFMPMLFVSGVMGKFIAVMPVAVIAMLLISLGESIMILPGHLSHKKSFFDVIVGIVFYPFRFVAWIFGKLNQGASGMLNWIVERVYQPALRSSLNHPAIVLCTAAGLLILSLGFVGAGYIPFVIMPKLDSREIEGKVTFPDGTPEEVTDEATKKMAAAIERVNKEIQQEYGNVVVKLVHRQVGEAQVDGPRGSQVSNGSHVGMVAIQLSSPESRSIKSDEIVRRWRQETGKLLGTESLTFGSKSMGPAGAPIELKLLAPAERFGELQDAVEEVKAELAKYPGVYDINDDSHEGKPELRFKVRPDAQALGTQLQEIAGTLRGAYYGEEVMRLQRGRHEIKLMVRYPKKERESLAPLSEMRYINEQGVERPLHEVATYEVKSSYSEINRINQLRSITITADVDEAVGNARAITAALRAQFIPELLDKEQYRELSVRWEGQQQQTQESMQSLFLGFGIALAAMLVLLTIQFRSYFQPFIIFAIIPFGMIGAVVGHWALGMPLTLFSMFGLVALTGVVINDSIVLIDFINTRVRSGIELKEALLDAGRRRFRPVLLTSVTTIAGLIPILAETSFQAQILVPMATSLCFGLLVATGLVLILVPTLYLIYHRATAVMMKQIASEEELKAIEAEAAVH